MESWIRESGFLEVMAISIPEKNLTDDLFEIERNINASAEHIAHKPVSYWGDSWKRLKKNKGAIIGLMMIIIIVFLALAGPFMNNHGFDDQNLSISNLPPKV